LAKTAKEVIVRHESLSVIEILSIARGYTVVDALVKKAQSEILLADAVTPGKFLIIFAGPVAEVEESLKAAIETAGDRAIYSMMIPHVHEQVLDGLKSAYPAAGILALGFVETLSVGSTILSLDAALKAAEVALVKLHMARGIGGKGYFVLTGELHEIEAAIEAARNSIPDSELHQTEIIARPHEDFIREMRSGA